MVGVQIKVPNWLDMIFAWPVLIYRKYKFGYPYRRIYLGEGVYTIVDPDVYYRLGHFKWILSGSNSKFYAVRNDKVDATRTKVVRLHREILNAPDGLLVDHQNTDSLDNRLANLRLATHFQNSCNRRRDKSKTTSRFTGVTRRTHSKRCEARINYNGKTISLGSFDSEIDAARAYDRAAIKYHGDFARLNFPREDYADYPDSSHLNKNVKNNE